MPKYSPSKSCCDGCANDCLSRSWPQQMEVIVPAVFFGGDCTACQSDLQGAYILDLVQSPKNAYIWRYTQADFCSARFAAACGGGTGFQSVTLRIDFLVSCVTTVCRAQLEIYLRSAAVPACGGIFDWSPVDSPNTSPWDGLTQQWIFDEGPEIQSGVPPCTIDAPGLATVRAA